MIYIRNSSNFVQIPKHSETISTEFKLTLRNIMNNTYVDFVMLRDKSSLDLFYIFDELDLESLVDGEYEYLLFGINPSEPTLDLLETGLLVCGDYKANTIEYEIKNTNVQYEPK